MSCENLVCASCAGRVVEGRCTTCRAARLEVHHVHDRPLPAQAVLLVAAAMALLLFVLLQLS